MSFVKWPEPLIEEIASRRVVVFFGSGVSANATSSDGKKSPPTWRRFLLHASKGVPRRLRASLDDLIDQNNLLLACDVIRDALGAEPFKRMVRAAFHDPGYAFAKVHEHILRLDSRISITPNFDVIYDSYVTTATSNTVLVKNYYDEDIADALRSKYPTVLKLHGSITTPDRLIFTASDYARARAQVGHVYDLVRALLCTHTFLFIGCGLDDPDIRMLLEDYRFRYSSGGQHYFLISKGSMHRDVLKTVGHTLNLSFVEFENSGGTFENFEKSLGALVGKVDLAKASAQ